MQNGLMTLGLAGIIDGVKGDSITLAPVSRRGQLHPLFHNIPTIGRSADRAIGDVANA